MTQPLSSRLVTEATLADPTSAQGQMLAALILTATGPTGLTTDVDPDGTPVIVLSELARGFDFDTDPDGYAVLVIGDAN